MKTISVEKLNSFTLQEENPKDFYKPLLKVHTTPDFSIASNGNIAGMIYNTEDHDLNYTFGNSLDIVTSILKNNHNEISKRVNCSIIFNRKEITDTITTQFKALKALVKEKHDITLYNHEAITHVNIDCENFKVYLKTETKNKYLDKKLSSNCGYTSAVSNQPDLCCDFVQPEVGMKLEEYKVKFNTKYLLDFFNFMTGYSQITITTIGSTSQIFCEEDDREVVLFPIR